MDKLGMKTKDISKEKFEILKELFPNAVTETVSENKMGGGIVNQISRTIDIDVLRQEINGNVVEGKEERYEFTWPEKKKAIIEANSPINKTLRPIREESVNFDTTENLYIEGDNLEALKLLRETYLGKIKMIYIDPPYNTGSDFIYNDDFSQSEEEFKEISGNYDEEGNRLFKNTDSNGRFHTDWLNMMYPRLKLARDLLTDDGVIFISIDDNEQANLKKLCDEIFGIENFYKILVVEMSKTQGMKVEAAQKGELVKNKEFILIYTKKMEFFKNKEKNALYEHIDTYDIHFSYFIDENKNIKKLTEVILENDILKNEIKKLEEVKNFNLKNIDFFIKNSNIIEKFILDNKENIFSDGNANINIPQDIIIKINNSTVIDYVYEGKKYLLIKTANGTIRQLLPLSNTYKMSDDFIKKYGRAIIRGDLWKNYSLDMGNINKEGDIKFKNGKKPKRLIKDLIKWTALENSLILDFFSGSATTAHAVLETNLEENKNIKYILVQIPELTKNNLDSYENGYENICEIGKERIRRAAKKLKEENPNSNFDDGFRVLRIDSSNMKDVYYKPEEFTQENLKMFESNIKEDRSGEDLLFQVMLDLGIELSNKIEEKFIQNNKIYDVGENFLIACFDENITEEVVTEIAKLKPFFAIFKEGNNLTDNTLINFEEIFKTYSPDTKRRVL